MMRRSSGLFKQFIFSKHAVDRMIEREIEPNDVILALKSGVVIEQREYGCCLILGETSKGKQIHIAVAIKKKKVIIITTYHPNVKIWGSDFKTKVV